MTSITSSRHHPAGTRVHRTNDVKNSRVRRLCRIWSFLMGGVSKCSTVKSVPARSRSKRRIVIWFRPPSTSQNRVAPSDLKSDRHRISAFSVKTRWDHAPIRDPAGGGRLSRDLEDALPVVDPDHLPGAMRRHRDGFRAIGTPEFHHDLAGDLGPDPGAEERFQLAPTGVCLSLPGERLLRRRIRRRAVTSDPPKQVIPHRPADNPHDCDAGKQASSQVSLPRLWSASRLGLLGSVAPRDGATRGRRGLRHAQSVDHDAHPGGPALGYSITVFQPRRFKSA